MSICELKLKIVLHCYIVELQWLAVLHNLLHAVTFHILLIVNILRCYINDNVSGESEAFELAAWALPGRKREIEGS